MPQLPSSAPCAPDADCSAAAPDAPPTKGIAALAASGVLASATAAAASAWLDARSSGVPVSLAAGGNPHIPLVLKGRPATSRRRQSPGQQEHRSFTPTLHSSSPPSSPLACSAPGGHTPVHVCPHPRCNVGFPAAGSRAQGSRRPGPFDRLHWACIHDGSGGGRSGLACDTGGVGVGSAGIMEGRRPEGEGGGIPLGA